ncbi:tetratricopeptide repeat protein [Thermodesulfobacteriota bacterium]
MEKNAKKALKVYEQAVAQGSTGAEYNMGRVYEEGQMVRKDLQSAIEWYTQAARKGNYDARQALKRLGRPLPNKTDESVISREGRTESFWPLVSAQRNSFLIVPETGFLKTRAKGSL